MGRRGYLYISGTDEKIAMFKEFLKIKKLSQKELGELYMDAIMISVDETLYLNLKKKRLKIDEVKEYIEFKRERGGINEKT